MKNGSLRKFLLIVSIPVFLFSTATVLKHRVETRIGEKHAEALVQMAVTLSPTQSVHEVGETTGDEFTEIIPLQVDFDALYAENQDVIAWLYCPDTPINYPVVQAADNDYYLRRLLDGSRNIAGTLFLDYRNTSDLSDWNCVIYGHNMNNGSMFGSLADYQSQSYFEAHPEIFLLTPEQNYVVELIAGYTTPANAALYTAFSPTESEKARFVESWLSASDFVSETVPAAEDHFITFSTCSHAYDNARYVLTGILRESGGNRD